MDYIIDQLKRHFGTCHICPKPPLSGHPVVSIGAISGADPESFVRRAFKIFALVIIFDRGDTYQHSKSGPPSARQRNAIFSLVGRLWRDFPGWGVWTPCSPSPSGSAHVYVTIFVSVFIYIHIFCMRAAKALASHICVFR